MAMLIHAFGEQIVNLNTNDSLAITSYAPVEVYQRITTSNQPPAWKLFYTTSINQYYTSAAVTSPTTFLIVAGPADVIYDFGASPSVTPPVNVTNIQATTSPLTINGANLAQGGTIAITGGTSSTSANAGGPIIVSGGTAGATGAGGPVTLAASAGGATSGAGGAVNVTAGNATAGNSTGGAVSVTSGNGSGTSNGGVLNISSGAGGTSGVGGNINILAGAGGATTGNGGAILIEGGAATHTGWTGGGVVLQGGTSVGVAGGNASVIGGSATSNGGGGNAQLIGGVGIGGAGQGGNAIVTGGAGVSNNQGGAAIITGGTGDTNALGGAASLIGGTGGSNNAGGDALITGGPSGAASNSAGGAVRITGGIGHGVSPGGDILVTPGAAAGSSLPGSLFINGIELVSQGAAAALTTSATLTAAQILSKIMTVNQGGGATSTLTLPTGTNFDGGFGNPRIGYGFDFSIINTSTNAAENAVVATNTGWTLFGDMDIAANSAITTKSSGLFRASRTNTATWTLFRLS